MKLTISTTTDTISDTINITVFFENNTTNDIHLLRKDFVHISQSKTSMWNLKIFFQDTIPMITPMLINYRKPTKKDYILIKSGDKYTFNFDVDFRTLIRQDLSNFRKLNDDYGKYILTLTYTDLFLVNKKALRGIIESNNIRLSYQK